MIGQTNSQGRKSIRLREYDYSLQGSYFVTVCARERANLFGEIIDGIMNENECGTIIRSCWKELPAHYRNILLDAFVLMPNHVHGIIIIVDDVVGARSPRPYKKITLGNIIAFFKYQSTKCINEMRNTPGIPIWQRNYYEHIIRNEKSVYRIREYISTNPQQWTWDKEYSLFEGTDAFNCWLKQEGKQTIRTRQNL